MKKVPYLNFRKDRGVYHTRYPIPDELRKHYPKGNGGILTHLILSVGSGSANEVKRKHWENVASVELEFERLRNQNSPSMDQMPNNLSDTRKNSTSNDAESCATGCTISDSRMAQLILDWSERYRAEQNKTLKYFLDYVEPSPENEEAPVYNRHDYKLELYAYHAKVVRGINLGDPDHSEESLETEELKRLLSEQNIQLPEESHAFLKMQRLMGEILIGLYQLLVDSFDSGEMIIRDIAPSTFEELRRMKTAPVVQAVATVAKPARSNKVDRSNNETVGSLLERYEKQLVTSNDPSKKDLIETRLIFRIVTECFGKTKLVHELEESDFSKLWTCIAELPDRRGKKFNGLSIKQSIQLAKKDKAILLSHSTANDYRKQIRQIFEYATERRLIQHYEFRVLGKSFTNKNRKSFQVSRKIRRIFFDENELSKIFSSPVFVGCAGNSGGSLKEGNKLFWNKRFWGCLIALFTGFRPAEIAQLKVKQIKLVNDMQCFIVDVVDEDQSLKTEKSKRIVPIHSKLIDLGLLEYIKGRNDEELILHEINRVNNPDDRARNLTRWFNEKLLPKLEIKTISNKEVFYCFRHTFATFGLRNGLRRELLELCGWSAEDLKRFAESVSIGVNLFEDSQLENYTFGGLGLEKLKEGIEKIQYPFINFEPMMPRNLKHIKRYEFEVQ